MKYLTLRNARLCQVRCMRGQRIFHIVLDKAIPKPYVLCKKQSSFDAGELCEPSTRRGDVLKTRFLIRWQIAS